MGGESMQEITILHLFPDLLNLYGDTGNIACLKKRLEWRGYQVKVVRCTVEDNQMDLTHTDIVFIGGGSDREQKIVCSKLLEKKKELTEYVENDGVVLAVCGAYQLLGKYYKLDDETIEGLSILDITTERGETRLIGNVIAQSPLFEQPIVGFENHGGRTIINNHESLAKIIKGYGNTGDTGYEGVHYKNVFATYIHGPLLPKNPQFCDEILSCALRRKDPNFKGLEKLDDSLENQANEAIIKRFG